MRTMTARYAGTCKTCGTRFPAGSKIGYAGRGMTYCADHLPAAPAASENPWKAKHLELERRFADPTNPFELAWAEKAVDGEYAGMDAYARPCPCGGTMHYRATVGALQCPDCRELAHTNGTLMSPPARRRNRCEDAPCCGCCD